MGKKLKLTVHFIGQMLSKEKKWLLLKENM